MVTKTSFGHHTISITNQLATKNFQLPYVWGLNTFGWQMKPFVTNQYIFFLWLAI